MEYKRGEVARQSKEAPAREGMATFVIATLNKIDSDGDIVLPGAIGRQTVPILPAHIWSHVPLGKAETYETGDKVLATAIFNMEVQAAREWHSALVFDLEHPPAKQEFSWGYQPTITTPSRLRGRNVRFLNEVQLHEISPVLQGASVGTHTVSAKRTGQPFASEELRAAGRWVEKDLAEQLQHEYLRFLKMQALSCSDAPAYDSDDAEDVDSRYVAAGRRRLAEVATARAAAQLGIAPPQVCWFRKRRGSKDRRLGWAYVGYGGEIHLSVEVSGDQLARVAAHETAHAAGMDEAGAVEFAAKFRVPTEVRV